MASPRLQIRVSVHFTRSTSRRRPLDRCDSRPDVLTDSEVRSAPKDPGLINSLRTEVKIISASWIELLVDEIEDPPLDNSPVGSVRVKQGGAVGRAVALQ